MRNAIVVVKIYPDRPLSVVRLPSCLSAAQHLNNNNHEQRKTRILENSRRTISRERVQQHTLRKRILFIYHAQRKRVSRTVRTKTVIIVISKHSFDTHFEEIRR